MACQDRVLRLFPQNSNFHGMWKKTIRGKTIWDQEEPTARRILPHLVDDLKARLPTGWSATLDDPGRDTASARTKPAEPDALLTIEAPDGSRATLVMEVRNRLDPKLVPAVADQLARYCSQMQASSGLVVAAYLSPGTQERLTAAGLSYADATGNKRLALDQPALYIETAGATSNPWAKSRDRPLRSLKGPRAGRVVRALCDFRPPYGVEQLAKRAGVSLASVSRGCLMIHCRVTSRGKHSGILGPCLAPRLLRDPRWSSVRRQDWKIRPSWQHRAQPSLMSY